MNRNLNYYQLMIEEWSKDRELDRADPMVQMVKLIEEVGELASGLNKNNGPLIIDSVGDIFVVLTIMCQQLNISLPYCVESAYKQIRNRKGKLIKGVFVKDEDIRKEPL